MRLSCLPAAIILNLCGTSGGERGDQAVVPHHEHGWSLLLPEVGARIEAEPHKVSFDIKDYSRWYDVRWVDPQPDLATEALREASVSCDPVVWDRAVIASNTWTAGGLCTRGSRFWWLISRVERHPSQDLLFFYVANPDFLAFEDAWVDFSRTLATFGGGADTPPPPEGRALRRKIRAAAADVKPTASPLPGSGVLSTHVIQALDEVWATRSAREPPPPTFDGSAVQSTKQAPHDRGD